jgi:hypothetical protein
MDFDQTIDIYKIFQGLCLTLHVYGTYKGNVFYPENH